MKWMSNARGSVTTSNYSAREALRVLSDLHLSLLCCRDALGEMRREDSEICRGIEM
jgi:hypothetical protein